MKKIALIVGLILCYFTGMATRHYGDSAPETYLAVLFLITYLFTTRRYWNPSFDRNKTKERTNL